MKSDRKALLVSRQKSQRREEEIYFSLLSCVLDHNSFSLEVKDKVLGFLRSKSYLQLLEFADSLCETEYPTAEEHFSANQLAALIRKYPFIGPIDGINPEAEALKKFTKAEKLCERYNRIWILRRKYGKSVLQGNSTSQRRARFNRILVHSKEWIWKVLGDEPNYQSIWSKCDFGPGASVGVHGNATHLAAKILAPSWSVTPTALPYVTAAMRSNPHLFELLCTKEDSHYYSVDPELFAQKIQERITYVTYNKIALVPKTTMVHRTIAVEPLLNGFIQKGTDLYIRSRLLRFGIDLSDQTKNQKLAKLGSLSGDNPFATIDLSSASDLISRELAKELLPPAWYHFLNGIRSHEYLLNGKKIPYHKFVSMGNGFCFPLETLIFASVCVAVSEVSGQPTDYSVYGDDIIVRQNIATEVLKTLRDYGFRHNPDKTFAKGPFRESCGADWYLGKDVRPTTLDYPLSKERDIIKFHNATLRSDRTEMFFREARGFLLELVPPARRFVRPYKGNDDTAFQVELDRFMTSPFALWNRETCSWSWKEYVSIPIDDSRRYRRMHGFSTVQVMAALRGGSSRALFTKRRNTRTRVRRVSHHGGHSTWLPSW